MSANSHINQILQDIDPCYICKKNITEINHVTCVQCFIVMHSGCEVRDRKNRQYTKCPNCNKVGTIGCINKHTYEFNKTNKQ